MKASRYTKIIGATAVFATICGLAAWLGQTSKTDSEALWYSVVPPALAIVLAMFRNFGTVNADTVQSLKR